MAERTSYAPGTPSWVDVSSTDTDASAAFYGALFGWEASEAGPVEETGGYRMFSYRGSQVAGLGPTMGGPPAWMTYVTVADVNASVTVATESGGAQLAGPMDVMDAGRMAVLADPVGAVFSIWQPKTHPGAGLVNEPGTLCWNELQSRDPEAAKAFYTALFGWGIGGAPDGSYIEWQVDGDTVGGMMPMPDAVPADVPSNWLTYFSVDDCDSTVKRIKELGGNVMGDPVDVPVGRFALASDTVGAVFAVIALAGV